MVKSTFSYLLVAVTGVIVAIVGVGAHRAIPYLGVALALIMVAAGAAFARAWKSWSGLALYAGAWLVPTTAFAGEGPGGSALIAGDPLGAVWAVGGAIAIIAIAVVPPRVWTGPHVQS